MEPDHAAADAFLARRVVKLQGGTNFRDLGGYGTQDGRTLRWGKLYRSGSMNGLTQADYGVLAELGIRRVVDLRTPEERVAAPNNWAIAAGIPIWSRDYKSTFGVLRELLASSLPTASAAREAMKAGYRRLPFEHLPAYRVVFEALRNGEIPLVFNCSAGKDRAGTAAALILAALGVPREVILEDYRLTDRMLHAAHQSGSVLASVSPEVVAVVMGTHPSYLACVFDAIDTRHGSMQAYLQNELALGAKDLASIRNALLE